MYGQKYGAKDPLGWSPAHETIFQLRHDLWNQLVPVYQSARERERVILCESDPTLVPLYEEVDRLDEQLEAMPHKTEEEREARRPVLDEFYKAQKALWGRVPAARRGCAARIKTEVWEVAQRESYAVSCTARDEQGLHWGDCNDVHDAFWSAIRAKKSPRFRRFMLRAALSRQLQVQRKGGERTEVPGRKRAKMTGGELVGATWAKLCSVKGVGGIRILPFSLDRARHEWKLLEMKLTEDMVLHLPFRPSPPIPEGAFIKRVRVTRERVTGEPHRYDWHVVFTVDAPPPGSSICGSKTVFAGLGWRVTPQGLRILAGIDTGGQEWHVTVPLYWLDQAKYARKLESDLRLLRNGAAEHVRKWRAANPGLPPEFDQRLVEASDPRRTRALLALAIDRSLPPELLEPLSTWAWGTARGKTAHRALLVAPENAAEILGEIRGRSYVGGTRSTLRRRRIDLYRRVARVLAQECGRLVLGELDGVEAAQADLPLPVQYLRHFAAPFELRKELEWQAKKSGCTIEICSAVDASRYCARHPEVDLYAGRDEQRLWLACERCGEALDRDANYALNLARRDSPDLCERMVLARSTGERSIRNITEELAEKWGGHGKRESRVKYASRRALASREES